MSHSFQSSQSFLTELGLSTPMSIIGPIGIGFLMAGFMFAFENPAIITKKAVKGQSMFDCWEEYSCYWCAPGSPPQGPFTPDNDTSGKIMPALAAISTACNNTGAPAKGCATTFYTKPCA